MRSRARCAFLLLAFLVIAKLKGPAQMTASEVAGNTDPSGVPNPETNSEIWQVEPIASALMMRVPSTAVPAYRRGPRNPLAILPDSSSSKYTFATYLAGAITKPSPGQFNYYSQKSWQSNGTGWGRSAEYRMRIRGGNYGGVLFSDTPTNGTIYVSGKAPFSWPIRRYEFDVLWTHQFAPVRRNVIPYVASGAGAIALNGGSTESGWDKQAALVAGAGSDVRLARFLTMRLGFTLDSLKASTYADRAYRSSNTILVEPRIGFVWSFGLPRPR